MEVRQANAIVRMLCAAYPTYPVGEDTSQLYVEILTQRDADDTLAAARNWILHQPQFPRISELVAVIRAEANRHPEPVAELNEPTRPRLTRDQLQAMRPKGMTHARHPHRARRDGQDA